MQHTSLDEELNSFYVSTCRGVTNFEKKNNPFLVHPVIMYINCYKYCQCTVSYRTLTV